MSNRSYLAGSNVDTIYPSFVQKEYDPTQQLVASDVESLPLLWLALFREDDLKRTTFKVQGQEIPAFAPVCAREKCLRQLDAAIPYLARIMPSLGPLGDYGAMIRSAIESLDYQFLSIELEEISSLYPAEHRFDELLTLALRGFERPDGIHFHCDDVTLDVPKMQVSVESMDDDEMDEELRQELEALEGDVDGPGIITIPGFTATSHAQVLAHLTNLKHGVPLPSVRMYLDDIPYSDDEGWNFTRTLGAGQHGSMGYGKEVPWEKEDANFGFEFNPADDDDDQDDDDV